MCPENFKLIEKTLSFQQAIRRMLDGFWVEGDGFIDVYYTYDKKEANFISYYPKDRLTTLFDFTASDWKNSRSFKIYKAAKKRWLWVYKRVDSDFKISNGFLTEDEAKKRYCDANILEKIENSKIEVDI